MVKCESCRHIRTIKPRFRPEAETPNKCFTAAARTVTPCGTSKTKGIQAISRTVTMVSSLCLVSAELLVPLDVPSAQSIKVVKKECLHRCRLGISTICYGPVVCKRVSTLQLPKTHAKMSSISYHLLKQLGENRHWCRRRRTRWMRFMRMCVVLKGSNLQLGLFHRREMLTLTMLLDTLIWDKREIQTIFKFK